MLFWCEVYLLVFVENRSVTCKTFEIPLVLTVLKIDTENPLVKSEETRKKYWRNFKNNFEKYQ